MPPTSPSELTVTGVSATGITLEWSDRSIDEDGFTIERSTDGISFQQIGSVTANVNVFADSGLRMNRTYFYRVRGFNAGGVSGYSNVVSAKTRKK